MVTTDMWDAYFNSSGPNGVLRELNEAEREALIALENALEVEDFASVRALAANLGINVKLVFGMED